MRQEELVGYLGPTMVKSGSFESVKIRNFKLDPHTVKNDGPKYYKYIKIN